MANTKRTLESKDLISRVDETSTTLKVISPKMQGLNEKISVGRDTGQALAAQLERARKKLQSIQAQLASLQALQRVVLGDEGQAVSKWLEHKGLSKAPRLMDKIKTEPGWEAAVETILGDYLEAVCVKDIEQTASSLDSIKTGRLMVLDQSRANQAAIIEGTLVAKVTSPVDLSEMLGRVFVAKDISSAVKKRETLESGQSVITKDGVWMGGNWLRISRIAANKGNVLQRKGEIHLLEKEVTAQEEQITKLVSELETCQRELYENENERDRIQSSYADAQKQHAKAEAEMVGWENEQEHVLRQEEQLQDYLEEVNRQIKKAKEEMDESIDAKQEAESVLKRFSGEREILVKQRNDTTFHLDGARSQEVERRESAHKLALNLESYRSALTATQNSLTRMKEQSQQLQQRSEFLQMSIQDGSAPLEQLSAQLKNFVDQRVKIEHSLSDARGVVQATEASIRAKQENNVVVQRNLEELRVELNELQLTWQEANVRGATLKEQIDEYGISLDSLLEQMDKEATLSVWEEKRSY